MVGANKPLVTVTQNEQDIWNGNFDLSRRPSSGFQQVRTIDLTFSELELTSFLQNLASSKTKEFQSHGSRGYWQIATPTPPIPKMWTQKWEREKGSKDKETDRQETVKVHDPGVLNFFSAASAVYAFFTYHVVGLLHTFLTLWVDSQILEM